MEAAEGSCGNGSCGRNLWKWKLFKEAVEMEAAETAWRVRRGRRLGVARARCRAAGGFGGCVRRRPATRRPGVGRVWRAAAGIDALARSGGTRKPAPKPPAEDSEPSGWAAARARGPRRGEGEEVRVQSCRETRAKLPATGDREKIVTQENVHKSAHDRRSPPIFGRNNSNNARAHTHRHTRTRAHTRRNNTRARAGARTHPP